ncbi:sugar diacid utilization regulator [Peribacillus deserti]|uniref:Sugar diacid utilization regulator n=1 Tax=Peribacillus deserti TaxID=673318 RepID=A0ABS2QN20_9BACI|nr:helix-turn-helix domain-containing protein [Peribacillus deserti]MBM7694154.1 sugar diacid utilization regulator [Peribacillus deserti]
MIDKLKQKYPNAFLHRKNSPYLNDYIYLKVSEEEVIGIPNEDVTKEESNLLHLLFPPDDQWEVKVPLSEKEQWKRFLNKTSASVPNTSWENVRFIFFTVLSRETLQREAEEAFLTLFPSESIIIWHSTQKGVLIEPRSVETLKKNELEPVLAAIESDFFIQFRLFVGSFFKVNSELPGHYMIEERSFSIGEQYSPEYRLQNISSTFPFLMARGLVQEHQEWFTHHLLGETFDDQELISTIKTYIECSSNASLAAKKLFMHRNSLQYRIDKFVEKTGLDIRIFEDALTVYLLIVISLANK